MNTTCARISKLSVVLLLGWTALASAQESADDLLNKHLGPTDKAPAPATQPAGEKSAAPVQTLTPEEQKLLEQLDNAALGKMLLEGKETGGMARVLELMGISRQQLAEKFNPGKVTQVVQKQIIIDLDAAIEQAKKNQGQGSGKGDSQDQSGSKRERGKGEQEQNKSGQGEKPDQSSSNANTTPGAGGNSGAVTPVIKDDNVERRREWGGLPARDREEVIQAGGDQPLEKFRELIDRYYSALNKEE